MRTIQEGYHHFNICDFCENDTSVVKWVKPIGNKGICCECVYELGCLLHKFDPRQLPEKML